MIKPRFTTDLSEIFFAGCNRLVGRLQMSSLWHLLGPMNAESGVWAKARNPLTSAAGLIQIMPVNLPPLGWSLGVDRFLAVPAEIQLTYVERYFKPHIGKLVSAAATYVAIFLPAFVAHAHDPDYVLVAKRGLPDTKLGWAYEANAVFDANGDGRITVAELEQAIKRNARGARWNEIVSRFGHNDLPDFVDFEEERIDLRTVIGVQRALVKLGYDLGKTGQGGDGVDGAPGLLTMSAVNDFRVNHGLPAGTNPGPRTQAALRQELDRLVA